MRAKEEYKIWLYKEKITSADTMVELAYTTGFNRAVELMELSLKEQENEFEHTTQG
jgi:predicted HTH domain antitoxin